MKQFHIHDTAHFSLHYHGPQLAGVDDAKWYDWEYKLRNTVIGLAYEQINEVLSNIARNHSGITIEELLQQLDRKEPSCVNHTVIEKQKQC